MKKFFVILFLIFISKINFAQFTEFHPELKWFTIKGEHCEVHFHEGTERTAKVVAKIADEVWEPITSLYQYEPETVHFVIKDIDDYSNGATYFLDNKIEIWSSALDFDLRGTHNWLRNVISHEFTHMVQIQAGLKTSRRIPALYLQWLNYEDERRPDILYGFPNVIASYPLAFFNVPAWFAEGTAQYMRKEFNYDNWDSHRDMILRSYILDGNLLTWNQMGVFDKTSLGNESVYNLGFALTNFIARKYGEDKLKLITYKLGKFTNFTIDAAFKDVLGKDGNEIYNEWKEYLTKDYKERTKSIQNNLVIGDTINKIGFGNFYPVFSNDGKRIFYISNKNSDYFSPSSIYEYDLITKKEKLIKTDVRSPLSQIKGTNKLIYSKLTEKNPNWYNVHDIFVYDIDTKKEIRLTNQLRANQPSVSNNGNQIVFIFQRDGTSNIGIIDIDGKNFKQLTFFQSGEQVYNPKFSIDDSFIIFDYSERNGRDIAKVNVDGSNFSFLIKTENDERNGTFSNDGSLIYASDKTGIFNLYKKNINDNYDEIQLTNVLGGAFMPSIDVNGNIVYAGYTSTGYKIFYLPSEKQKKILPNEQYVKQVEPPLDKIASVGDMSNIDFAYLQNYDDTKIPDYQIEKYKGAFSKLSFFPFIRFDNYNTSNNFTEKIKPGLYVASNDMLNRYAIFASASINTRAERDLFFSFEYKNKLPLLYDLGIKPELTLELYNISRKADVDIFIEEFPKVGTDVTYSLFEVDVAAKHRIFSRNNFFELRYIYSNYTASLGSFIFPGTTDLYPKTHDTYFIGSNFQLSYNLSLLKNYIDSEINPIGFIFNFKYNLELNRFNNNSEYTIDDGILKPLYNHFDFHRLEVNSSIHYPVWKNHTLSIKVRVGSILNHTVPDFFDFYLGGLIGMKAYPFYAISGNEVFWSNLTYRFPLFRNIDTRIGNLYLDKIFFSIYGDFGNAWNGEIPGLDTFKKGAGAEIRIAMNSFYQFPTSIFFNVSYGFDKFSRTVNDELVTYGKEFRFYGGILFSFDIY